jgi:hypothetical protein
MSVVFNGTTQGRFISTGAATLLNSRQDVDWMYVRNETVSYAAGADTGAEFYWQRGMTQGRGNIYTKTAATNTLQVGQIDALRGFYLIDTSLNVPGAAVALTGITDALPPVVNTGSTAGLAAGDIVRIFNTVGARQLGSIDFTIGNVVANTSFTLAHMAAIVNANPGAGTYRRIPFDPIFYPRNRYISKISSAANAIVTLTVTHGLTVGQKVRFVIPTVTAIAFGMTALNEVEATIIAVGVTDGTSTNTITVDVDTTAMTAFAWPLTANYPFTAAQIVPVGQDTAESLILGVDILADATRNTGQIGMLLQGVQAGLMTGPAGRANDVIYWVAGKSFNS